MSLLASALSRPCSSRFAASLTRFHLHLHPTSYSPITQRPLSTSLSRLEQKDAQPQTAATDSIELDAPVTYISESHDPWFNLSYEDWLMRNTPNNQPVLFLYRNFPCVVIGRNQNPWKETTPHKLREASIPLVRRRSGGGTVYHDMGNTNFSIILPRLLFTRSHGAELVAAAIRDRLGIEGCTVNDRNDVVIREHGKEYKMSSAYKIIQHRAYHHGTMLISSSLTELGKSLKSSSPNMETKGIPSHRSAVTTLNHHLPSSAKQIHHDHFVKAVTAQFEKIYSDPSKGAGSGSGKKMETREVHPDWVKDEKVWKSVKELKSWEWQYGQTPEFSNQLQGDFAFGSISASLTARHALITSLTLHLTPPVHGNTDETASKQEYLDCLALSLIGCRYETLDGAEGALGSQYEDEHWRELGNEVLGWLRKVM
ncbi:lipoate-protein ligase A [Kwoniella heveanensis BCC8398]|uniref:Putative lipoate-protein ligase A n=1 Tax=Kwoniella heveanensis BCC8398 TaxID=1296120 RepID=A0A1B9GWI4_9TREE|nr:lipoate-protein ligase A [Kwoniella heveanensis BCC8398]